MSVCERNFQKLEVPMHLVLSTWGFAAIEEDRDQEIKEVCFLGLFLSSIPYIDIDIYALMRK